MIVLIATILNVVMLGHAMEKPLKNWSWLNFYKFLYKATEASMLSTGMPK